MCKNKNQIFSIKILEKVLKINNDLVLILIGKIDDNIINYIKENKLDKYIIITGVVENVNDYLNIMDIFLYPSLKEGYGLALIEAQKYDNLLILVSSSITRETNISNKVKYLDLEPELWYESIKNYINEKEN